MADYYRDKDGKLKKKEEPVKYKYVRDNSGKLVRTADTSNDSTWFKKGALADGYQFGDVTKTILGTRKDTKENLYTGVISIAESAIDAGATLLGGAGKLVGADDFQANMRRFVEKDMIDEKKVARTMDTITGGIPSWVSALNNKYGADEASVFGDKADSLLQSGGQLAGTAALQSVGVPWYVTTGTTSFGSQAEEAFKEGATYGQAVGSALISAGAEILTEKLSGGISFGGKTLDDVLLKPLTEKISSKAVKALVNLGMDAVGEGAEEVITSVISNLGTKLYKEESIGELLASEEAMDEYIESFIGGAFLGGGMNIGKAVKSIATGRDYNTGLTENEQAVIDKEVENRIKEREETGEKISKREKASIEEQVKSDLAKGYIGIDTIESVLGGDDYKAYKDVSDREDALMKEFEELGKKQNATLAEQARYAKLEQQIEEMKGSSEKSKLKEQLSQRVSELAKSDRLAESYNEKTRRSQAYTADLAKYGEKQQAVVKAAVESGILNNTNRTHEFVDMLAKIAADKGVSFDFTNNQKLRDSGFALEGKTVNGFLKDGSISLNIESAKALNTVVGHEITHVLEGSELYGELQQAVKMYAESKGEYGKRLEALQKLYAGVEGANIENELTADLIGDYLFTDSDFVNRLSTEKPGLFKRIFEEIKYLLKTATAGSKQARELEKVKRTFEKAYRENGATKDNTTKFSIAEIEGKQRNYGVGVVLDTNIFDGVKPRNWNEVVKDYVYNNLAGTELTVYDNGRAEKIYLARKNDRAQKEGANNPNRVIDKLARHRGGDNIRNLSIVHIDELAQVSELAGESTENKHQWLDENGWEYRTAYAQDKNGRIYEMSLNIAKSRDGRKILYDINNIKEIDSGVVASKGTQRNNQSLNTKVSQDGEKVKYSMSDSAGRRLSEGQREYFKDSKVRDENGALKPVYHGTKAEFTEFDISKNRVITFGNGFYFGENQEAVNKHYAGDGGRVMEVYLDIKNPFVIEQSQLKDIDSVPGVIMETLGIEGVTKYNIMHVLKEHGYDGIHYRNKGNDVYVAYSPEQIKAVDNQNPTENRDINLSLSETSVDIGPIGINVYGKDIALEEIAPVQQQKVTSENLGPVSWEKVAEGFATEYDAWDKKNPTKVFKVAITSEAMRSIGVEDKVITMDSGKLIKIRSKHEGMTDDVIKQIPSVINDPVLIVESKTDPSRIVMMGELTDANGKTVLAVLELNPTSRKGIALDEIKIASAYGKDNLQRFVETSKILYVNQDKQKTSSWVTSTGLQLPVESLTTGSTNSIPQNDENATLDFGDELPTWGDVKKAEVDTYTPEPESYPKKKVTTVKERNAAKLQSLKVQLKNEQDIMEKSHASYNAEIRDLQSLYDSKKNKNTRAAQELLDRIERRKNSRDNTDAYYEKRINDIKTKIGKMNTKEFKIVEQRQSKEEEYGQTLGDLMGDTSTWRDKKLGIYYKINTLRRNLRDIVRDENGNRDIAKADAIYDEIQGKYNHNEAQKNREANAIREEYAELKITAEEDAYIQMLGEYRHNPDTTLTADVMKEYYEKHKKKIDTEKVDKIIASARQLYDELFRRVNAILEEHGMRPIEYREGYFPHFTDDKQSWLAKLLNWKTRKDEIPTDIAGLTEQFKPVRSWQSFDKHRTGDNTDYSFKKGLDMYVQGALDWIYHIEDIQKRRAFENEIRYRHSDQGIRDKVEAIRNNPEYDASEVQDQIDLVYKEARNPLNNFISDFRTQTNTLAGKKSSMDRGTEEWTNRTFYSTMQNISNRVTANMVVGSFSSALTNFIPITQSWAEVSPASSLVAMRDTIKSYIKKDSSAIDNSDFLTNRLQKSKKLYQSTWDKAIDKLGGMMEAVDNFTSQVVWRSKYLENMNAGMSENEAIKNADQFAENVMAGRSRGNNPTIFDAKNPFIKIATAFQLEVNNQYGYLFKDVPQELRNEVKGKLVAGYAKVFIGAWFYNMAYSALTGRDAALDPIGIIEDLLKDLGLGDDEEPEEPAQIIGNLTESVAEELPFIGGLLGGGRIPISSALPYDDSDGFVGAIKDLSDDVANWKDGGRENFLKEMANPASYLLLPAGGGQAKKTIQGLGMFSDKHPIAGSYTNSGKLRFSVEDTPLSRLQAALFGQWSSQNAREYIEEGRSPLGEKQTQELVDTGLPMADYWKYRDGLKEQSGTQEKIEYIAGLDLPIDTKNILVNNAVDRKTPVDLTEYDNLSGYEEFDFFSKNKELYNFLQENGVSYWDYKILGEDVQDEYKELQKDSRKQKFLKENGVSVSTYCGFSKWEKDAYDWAYKNPEKYRLSQVITKDVVEYKRFMSAINAIPSDKDENGKTIKNSQKKKVERYINGLNIDYGQKLILFRSLYEPDDTYNYEIVEYLNGRDDISRTEMESILKSLGFTVYPDGTVKW